MTEHHSHQYLPEGQNHGLEWLCHFELVPLQGEDHQVIVLLDHLMACMHLLVRCRDKVFTGMDKVKGPISPLLLIAAILTE